MSKPRVLLADDDIGVANALSRLLDDTVELVGVVHDGVALVRAAQELKPDVIVTDLSMPSMSGLEATRLLKQEGVTARIIFLTMYSDSYLADEAFRLGASAYLEKFAAGEDLVDVIHQAFAADGTVRMKDES